MIGSLDPMIEPSSNHQQISLYNSQEGNAMSTLATFGKTNRKTRIIRSITFSIGFLLYTVTLVGISYYWIPKMSDETESLPTNLNRGKVLIQHLYT